MYSLGRQAFDAGYPIEACNISKLEPKRSWWVAGHIDAELEAKSKAWHDVKNELRGNE
jgi:hypothetical protein